MYKKLFVCLSMLIATSFIEAMPQLVELTQINPRIRVQLVYATPHNFTGKIIYKKSAKAYLLKEVAQALSDVQKELELQGFGLLVWDAYRPMQGQQALWDAFPDERFVSPPQKGGRHTRGTTVDLTLVRLSDGTSLEMPSGFDSFTPQAASACADVSSQALKNRTLLQNVMKKHGFTPIASEWWHFDYKGWQDHEPLAIDFDMIS